MSHRTVPRVVVAAFLVASGSAAADPIQITRGGASYENGDQARYDLFGEREFSAFFTLDGNENHWVPYACNPCATGSLLNPSISESLGAPEFNGFGDFTLGRTTHHVSTGHLAFDVPAVVIPKPMTVNLGTPEEPELIDEWVFRMHHSRSTERSPASPVLVSRERSGCWEVDCGAFARDRPGRLCTCSGHQRPFQNQGRSCCSVWELLV
jgi:hypothetical protein